MMTDFNVRKSAQLVAWFAGKAADLSIDVIKAVKLVYLSDRAHMQSHGYPILDEPRYSLDHGPINSYTRNFISGEVNAEGTPWSEYLSDRSEHQIGALKAFDRTELDELSDAEIDTLEVVWGKFGKVNTWDLVEWTHDSKNLPEWEHPGGGSRQIPMLRILNSLGYDPKVSAELVERYDDARGADDMLTKGPHPF